MKQFVIVGLVIVFLIFVAPVLLKSWSADHLDYEQPETTNYLMNQEASRAAEQEDLQQEERKYDRPEDMDY